MRHLLRMVMLLVFIGPGVAVAQVTPAPAPMPPHPPAVPIPAHPPGHDLGKWWKNSEIARELQLAPQQISQIEQTFFEHRLKLIDLRAELEKQETRLQPLMEADQPDEGQVSGQIDQVLAARGRLEKANAMMMLSIRRVLSVEQWKKLQSIQQERDRMFFRPLAPPRGPFHLQPFELPTPPPRPDEEL